MAPQHTTTTQPVDSELLATKGETMLAEVVQQIPPVDQDVAGQAQDVIDNKTKPRGSLADLEALAIRLATAWGSVTMPDTLRGAVVVAAADHGVAAEGISAYPQEVTAQMVANFAAGGAAINAFCAANDLQLHVVDIGVAQPIPGLDGVIDARWRAGTDNLAAGPAMTRADAARAVMIGVMLAQELCIEGADVVALGDMGIGNTTASSAIAAAVLGVSGSDVAGAGTGIDKKAVARKASIIDGAVARIGDKTDALDVLVEVGGLEIALLAGVCLGTAAERKVVLVDGLITTAAALVADLLSPNVRGRMVAAHLSAEGAHSKMLEHLELSPLLRMGLRLGEGSGAALAYPLLRSAAAMIRDMASFADAAVTDTGK